MTAVVSPFLQLVERENLVFPTRKSEQWRYTDVQALRQLPFTPQVPAPTAEQLSKIQSALLPGDHLRLVFVNGDPLLDLCRLNDTLQIETETPAQQDKDNAQKWGDAFEDLNHSLVDDTYRINVTQSCELEMLNVVLSQGMPLLDQSRISLEVQPKCHCVLMEHELSLTGIDVLHNREMVIDLNPDASLEYQKLTASAASQHQLDRVQVHQRQHSQFTYNVVANSSQWQRLQCSVFMIGEGADCHINGLGVAGDSQLVDFHLDLQHQVPSCSSNTNIRAIVDGIGRVVVDGAIKVFPDAQKSRARLNTANLLLALQAEVDCKPQLEILADDVECSHGATVGQLSEEMIFYLRSRGMSEAQARQLLCVGFAQEVLQEMSNTPLKTVLEHNITGRLANSGERDV
ncbi:MAG: SufB/SufD family protein [bacterium]